MIFLGIKLFDNIRLNILSHDIACLNSAAFKRGSIKKKKRVETL